MKKLLIIICIVSLTPSVVFSGNLDSPGLPSEPSSAMYNMADLYNRLTTGANGSLRTSPFLEPASPPAPSGYTIDDIISQAPVADTPNGALPTDVLSGKTYWSLRTDGSWGKQTGNAPATGISTPVCNGTLTGTRWCNNGDGTITDMTTSLVWLQNADCWGLLDWHIGLLTPITDLKDGQCGLNGDASTLGDWRLPTLQELYDLTNGAEGARTSTPQGFNNMQNANYWSATTISFDANWAQSQNLGTGLDDYFLKTSQFNVLPVRSTTGN